MTEKSISIITKIFKTLVSLNHDNYERFKIFLESNRKLREASIYAEGGQFQLLNEKINKSIKNVLDPKVYISLQEEYSEGMEELIEKQKEMTIELEEILNKVTITNSRIAEKLKELDVLIKELEGN